MEITRSFGSRFSLACVRKSLNVCPLIPPWNDEWKASPLVGEIASATVTFLPWWPRTRRYALSLILGCPWLLVVQILCPHSSTNILGNVNLNYFDESAYLKHRLVKTFKSMWKWLQDRSQPPAWTTYIRRMDIFFLALLYGLCLKPI